MGRTSPIEAARSRHPLADVARRTAIPLSATTGTATVRCPIPAHGHPDRTPSMRLYLDDDRYYCFGCGAKGDVVQWVRDLEGLGVTDAIRHLDSHRTITNTWAGRPYNSRPSSQRTEVNGHHGRAEPPDLSRTSPERVSDALQAAWAFYSAPPLHHRGSAYLGGRGIDIRVLEDRNERPEVGHTSTDPAGLTTFLRSLGYGADELVDAGLAQRYPDGGRVTDFYRHRVLVPIHDEDSRIVGLIGRNVGDSRYPKYKNPPRTHTYDKSISLFQPLPAPAHPAGRVVIVEGTLDAVAMAVAAVKLDLPGLICPVTQSGRELSETQMQRVLDLQRRPPVLGFDGDEAGLDSAARYALAFTHLGSTPVVAVLPPEHDPASWLAATGPKGLFVWLGVGHCAASDIDRFATPAARPVGARTPRGFVERNAPQRPERIPDAPRINSTER